MSKTLNLCEILLVRANRCLSVNAFDKAQRIYDNLRDLRKLPKHIAAETQQRLGELLLKQGKYLQARRHLAAALTHNRKDPQSHYLMACAHHRDPEGDRNQALLHYRMCLQLEPLNADYFCDAGLFAAHNVEGDQGVTWLRAAVKLAPNDPRVIAEVVGCLQELGHEENARQVAQAALFRNSRDRRFHRLWNDFRFRELLRKQQQAEHRRTDYLNVADERVSLPFLQLTVETPSGRKLVRRDGASGLAAPHGRSLAKAPHQNRA